MNHQASKFYVYFNESPGIQIYVYFCFSICQMVNLTDDFACCTPVSSNSINGGDYDFGHLKLHE